MKQKLLLVLCLITLQFGSAQSLYFPPTTGNTWQTMDPADLGWCDPNIQSLYTYLEETNSKAFIVLKDGKIVLEKYFGTFTKDSLWLWNSAGKTLTAFTIGIAQQEGFLSIDDTTSTYLGAGWTSLTPAQEEKITIRHQLSMTTGLDESQFDCLTPSCLTYLAAPGTRWAYHNSPYTLLDGVIANATGQTLNAYVTQKIKNPIGMNGLYVQFGNNNVFVSNARSMARFGLLMLAEGNWNGTAILNDPPYFQAMTNSSQTINPSYGYLTWLNGKNSFMVPQSQFSFNGSVMPNAPDDVYAALGKNGQIINVSPSENLVFIRMGNDDGNSLVSNQYNDTIWQKINLLGCTNALEQTNMQAITAFPNPANDFLSITSPLPIDKIEIRSLTGQVIPAVINDNKISLHSFSTGFYFVQIYSGGHLHTLQFTKN